jgi:hypothetical protein
MQTRSFELRDHNLGSGGNVKLEGATLGHAAVQSPAGFSSPVAAGRIVTTDQQQQQQQQATTSPDANSNPSTSALSGLSSQGTKSKGRSGPKSKCSPFIGVSQYKRTGRWEVSSCEPVLP